jgi:hypothetical protein
MTSNLDRLSKLASNPSRRWVAHAVILDAYDRMRCEHASWMTPRRLLPLIRRHEYPWGERKHWPYKAWLMACRDVLAFLEHRPLPCKQARRLKALNPLEQQELPFPAIVENAHASGNACTGSP